MKINHTTNILLAIIAACLLLITSRLYNIGVTPSAYAEDGGYLTADHKPMPVALYARDAVGVWYPCKVGESNNLLVEIVRKP